MCNNMLTGRYVTTELGKVLFNCILSNIPSRCTGKLVRKVFRYYSVTPKKNWSKVNDYYIKSD